MQEVVSPATHAGTPVATAPDAGQIIDALGGTVAVSRICGVTSQAVSQWRRQGIPRPWLMFFSARNPALFDGTARAA